MPKKAPRFSLTDVFINLPFDTKHERVFLALIAGLVSLGLTPRSVLQIAASEDRLRRLHDVISQCGFSLHDLCRVQLSNAGGHRVPRFNMPFELGLAVGIALADERQRYNWRTLEQKPHRIGVSLSDIAGYDTSIHHGTVRGTLEALLDIFEQVKSPPLDELDDLACVYRRLRTYRSTLGDDIFRPRPFVKLVAAAKAIVDVRVLAHRTS